jgi:hypothetical protein
MQIGSGLRSGMCTFIPFFEPEATERVRDRGRGTRSNLGEKVFGRLETTVYLLI